MISSAFENHQRFVSKPVARWRHLAAVPLRANKKAGARPAFFAESNPARSILRDDGTAPTIVDADQTDIDVLADAIGARDEACRRREVDAVVA
jgi:hypothetical protein